MNSIPFIPSSNHLPFDYGDIAKRSMLTDPAVYHRVLCTLCTHLELTVIPPIATVAEKYGFQRFAERAKTLAAEYKVTVFCGLPNRKSGREERIHRSN